MPILRKQFEIGPGTSQPLSHFRTFSVPAHSTVSVAVEKLEIGAEDGSLPVIVDVHQAAGTSIGSSGPDGPLLASRIANAPNAGVQAFQNISFSSPFGCPSSWRIRVRAGLEPLPARVSGTIVFQFDPPGTVTLDMAGTDTQHLDPSTVATRTLRHRAGTVPADIDGTGVFRIRAKWHTDPANVLQFNTFHPLTVALLRPNGSVADSQTGFSRHAPADKTPKLGFQYTVTPADVALNGDWRLRITNGSPVRVVDFDIDRGADPNPGLSDFRSTFNAECV
jgi:hypothetical protein